MNTERDHAYQRIIEVITTPDISVEEQLAILQSEGFDLEEVFEVALQIQPKRSGKGEG